MTHREFIASRDLNPSDFDIFSAQYVNDLNRMRQRLRGARREARQADDEAAYLAASIRRLHRAARKHGVQLPE